MKINGLILTSLASLLCLSLGCKSIGLPDTAANAPGDQVQTMTAANQQVMPSPLDASLLIAREHERANEFDQAIQILEGILAEQGNIPAALHRLAVIHSKLGNLEVAGQYFETAAATDPQNAELLADYGFLNFMMNDLLSAEQNYMAAINIEPSLQRAHNNLAILLTKTNRLDLARTHFQWAGISESEIRENIRMVGSHAPVNEVQVTPAPLPLSMNPPEAQRLTNTFFHAKRLPPKKQTIEPMSTPVKVVQTTYLNSNNESEDKETVEKSLSENPADSFVLSFDESDSSDESAYYADNE